MKHLAKIYALFFISIIMAIAYLYISLTQTENILNKNINHLFITQAQEFASNIQRHLHTRITNNLYNSIKNDPLLKKELEEDMTLLATNNYKYIYILYKDSEGDFRYLLDGSKEDKGELDEKLNVDKQAWNEVYTSQKPKVIYQNKLENLWVTYLEPVVFDGKTQAIIAIDFSTNLPKDVQHATQPINHIFLYIFIAIFIMLLILLYQTLLNFRTKQDAITDPLTQTYNRNYLRDLLKNINISKYQIIMLDIDHFKYVNDSYGHKIGDNILSDVSSLIKNTIRNDDIFIRFGGEEFLLFIHRKNTQEMLATQIAQRIRHTIEEKVFTYNNITLKVTVSMGITCAPEHFKNISDAIKHADELLYIAKREGRNRVVSDTNAKEIPKNSTKTFNINDVKDAIEENRLICHYQAIFCAQTQKVIKYEALVRIVNKDGSMVYPNQFLPNIIHTNLYNQMTKMILDIVFEKIKQNKVSISVNLNFSDIINKAIFKLIIEELEKNKDVAPWLTIELLEYEVLEAEHSFINNIKTIQSYGVKISIDDFGAGFANYNVFQILKIDTIKIDGSLIKNIDTSETSYKIVKSIAFLTHELGIETVAEFVHSLEVYKIVKELGITKVQGFYFAKPQENLLNGDKTP